MLFKAVPFVGLLGAAAMLLRRRTHRENAATGKTWPSQDEIALMDAATLNDFLASRGLDVRVVDDVQEASAV